MTLVIVIAWRGYEAVHVAVWEIIALRFWNHLAGYGGMVLAVSNQGLKDGSRSLTQSAIKPKWRKAVHYQLDSAILHKKMKLFSPLEPSW